MQKKQGFTFPIARWFKSSLKRSLIKMKKSNDWHEGILKHKKIEELIDEHLSGKQNNYRILFNLLSFYSWRNKYPMLNIINE